MVRKRGLVDAVEAAYRLDVDDAGWLEGVAPSLVAACGEHLGGMAWLYDARAPETGLRVWGAWSDGRTTASVDVITASHERLPAEHVRRLYLEAPIVSVVSEIYGVRNGAVRMDEFEATLLPHGIRDSIGLNSRDPDGLGCIVTTAHAAPVRLDRRARARLGRLTAHVAAGMRLRRRLAAAPERALEAEAVLDPGGRLLHAEGPARGARAREALRTAARAVDRARGRLRERAPDEALELWRGLVAGRWTLLDRFDSDGRRFLVARQNPPDVPPLRPLSERERRVASYAAMGHSNKQIAYELGLATSTVSTVLARALRKLGLRRRTDLTAFAAVARRPDGEGADQ